MVTPPPPHSPPQDDAEEDLEALRISLMQQVAPFLREHIWQRDPFELESSRNRQPPWARKAARKGEGYG